jgi:short subunit dehydrogenase-like uncharacterized protein
MARPDETSRRFDVLLYGAGGFTGRQTVAYLTRRAPRGLRWAIAGRRRDTLEAARAAAKAPLDDEQILVADSADQRAVDAAVSQARVVLSTAGPFALYGTSVVDACVRHRTHYVDITGETRWAREMITRYFGRAALDGTRIIPFCGFDSIPSDLGTFLLVRYLQETIDLSPSEVRGYFELEGGLNGGTIASALNLLDSSPDAAANDPFYLDPAAPHSEDQRERSRGLRTPQYDAAIGTWVGPFFMAPVNTRVVRRSAALYGLWGEPYGADFVYREAAKYGGRIGAYSSTLALGALLGALQRPATRRVAMTFLPKPGQGPSERRMNEGWFRCELLALSGDSVRGRALIAYAGDPGNRATVCFVCEAALALALDADKLPGAPSRGGVLTPATGLGIALANRLRDAGTRIEIESHVTR